MSSQAVQKTPSLRTTLKKRILPPILGAVVLIVVLSSAFAYHEINEVYDADLAHFSKIMRMMVEREIQEDDDHHIDLAVEEAALSHRYEKKIAFAAFYNGQAAMLSPQLAQDDYRDLPDGFSNKKIDGQVWRFFVSDEKNHIRTAVGENAGIRFEIMAQILLSLLLPFLLLMPVVLYIIFSGLRSGTASLSEVSAALDNRMAGDTAPLPTASDMPREVSTIVRSINNLFQRITAFVGREKSFIENAAHELRTPLAAIRIQTQVLLKSPSLQGGDHEGLENLHDGIVRASNLVEQLLSFSRFQADMDMQEIDLSCVCNDVVSSYAVLAAQKGLRIKKEIAAGVKIKGNLAALEALLGNILVNAIKFSPEEGDIRFSLALQEGRPVAVMVDQGVGIPDDKKEKVFERFYRNTDQSVPGSGLGLAICRSIADMHKARIRLFDNAPRGLRVEIAF